MSTQRYAPVRVASPSSWLTAHKLPSALSRVVDESRHHQQRFAERYPVRDGAELAPAYAELRKQARSFIGDIGPGPTLERVMPEALGLAALAADRLVGPSWEMRPRDNQLACATVLSQSNVAELDTGEGKTLCVALAAICWALVGRVHVVTANDYLARRDYQWMKPLFEYLGVTVKSVEHESAHEERQEAYQAEVTYVSVKEVGADYLRDTLTSERSALLLPALETAILDEIDFILVDEARIPLILAEQIDLIENLCHQFNEAVEQLVAEQEKIKDRFHQEIDQIPSQAEWTAKKRTFETTVRLSKLLLADSLDPRLEQRFNELVDAGDGAVVRRARDMILRFDKAKRHEELVQELLFTIDRKAQAVQLTETGLDRLYQLFGDLFDEPGDNPEEIEAHRARLRAVHNLIAGHVLYRRDHDYIIDDGKIVLVDQATGRPSFDRHLQHGLHRALEAKEKLYPLQDHRTAAEITFPGLFQLYDRFCGTSGTCLELGPELKKTFRRSTVRIPAHRPVIRADYEDVVFRNKEEKVAALVQEVLLSRRLRQPVLVGTASVEQSEWVSAKLESAEIPHQVLNARHHEKEAKIIARAGEPATVTVATTMAGRGTDIRPPEDLAEQIAGATADWLAEEIKAGTRKGARIEVFSLIERDILLQAAQERGLTPRISRRRRRSTVIDMGAKPPSTAFPLSLGMRIIGFERLGASRLDRQLRGRTGRQGNPGSTRFYLSLDDEIALIHGDRAKLAELRRKSRPLLDPLSSCSVRSSRALREEMIRSWRTFESLAERQRERLNKLDVIDQVQRQHYDQERRALLFANDETVMRLTDQALERAVRDVLREVVGEVEWVNPELEVQLDNFTEILFERRGLFHSLLSSDEAPKFEAAVAHLVETLERIYAVARHCHGSVMAQVERTVLLDALTEVWRNLSGERPDLRQQAELYGYANQEPEDVYRRLAGQAYHQALANASRTAASVLVTFPLPRELKTQRTGVPIEDDDVLRLFV